MKTITKLWIFIIVLAFLTPLGLILPEHFKAGVAWGEWGVDEIKELAGYIPEGLAKLSSLWAAPIPDYAFKGWEKKPSPTLSIAYIISAVAGILVTIAIALLLGKFFSRRD